MNIELYKSSLNNIKDCIAIYKVVNNGEDFHFVFFNNAAEKLENIKEEEILNKSVLSIFPGIKDFGLFEVFQNVYKFGNKTNFPIKTYKDDRIEGFRDNIVLKIDEKHIMAIYSDKTKEKINEEKLNETLSFLNSYEIALNTSSIVSKADLQGNITYVNDNFCKITGYSKKEVIGKPHSILRHPDNDKKIFKDLWDTVTSKKVWNNTIKNKDRYSNDYWIDISIIPILDSKNRIIEYISVRHDITKTIKQQNHLKKTVNFDSLTGLGNKYKLQNDIKKSTKHSLAIINIDNFSEVNDFYGHKIGDLILKVFSDKLKANVVNNTYKLYRLHADEFVIFNSEVTNEFFLSNLTVTIAKLKKEVFELKKEEIHFTFTVAISFENRENILSCASMALKKAKKENHDILIYNKSMSLNDKYKNNIRWTKKIKKALDNNNFIPVYQSIVSNIDKKVEKYECLARLREDNKLLSPFYFLELSKTNKQYLRISKMIIRKSFDTLSKNRVPFSLNLTIEDILNDNMKDFIYEMLEVYKIGELITFEIVESESIKNFNKVLAFIQKVKAYNCKIAIDDFGTGYSNFEYLIKLKADYIKIDGSLIRNITVDPISEKVVKNLALFAKDLGMKTIAEYVENESIFNKVKELGIDYSQGFYFSEPNVNLL